MKKVLSIIVIIMLLFSTTKVEAAIKKGDTLGDLKKQLTDLKNKKKAQENEKAKTEAEIKKNQADMEQAEVDLYKAKEEVENLKVRIEKTNEELEKKKKESEELLILYQKLQEDNIYMEYITGASTMTELIMRMDAIKELTNYNEQQLTELELLISNNDKMNKELDKYQVELDQKIENHMKAIEELGDKVAELVEGAVTIDEEIETMNELVKYYQDLGCKDDQDLIACVEIANNDRWVKPVTKGRITSEFGLRFHPTQHIWKNHNGIDIGVSEGTPVYAAAAGQVGAIVKKSSCGGNMMYIWTYIKGKPYTYVYMHLSAFKKKVGDKVTINDVVALSGGGSSSYKNGGYDKCTTGAHLHFGVSEGHHFGAPNDLSLSKFNSYLINPPGFPGLYEWFYSRW